MLDISTHIANKWGHLKGKTIYVSCSAGVDSTVLAILLKRLGFKVIVIHINYQLRGKDSDLDALFVKSFCGRERITCLQKTVCLQNQLEDGGNLQEIARNERYDWFKHIIYSNPNNYIALGHHQDDQVETFFLNIGRKAGIMGLSCMLKEHNNIIRPLLDFSRAEIIELAKADKIDWREDKTNASNKYRRNLLRNIVLPEIKSEIPSIDKSVLTLIQYFQKKQEEIMEKITPLTQGFIQRGLIEIESLKKLNNFESIEFLRQLNQPAKYISELLKLCKAQKGKKIKWGDNWLINEGDVLLEQKESQQNRNLKFTVEQVGSLPNDFDKNVIYLDKDKISGALQLRPWNIGDRIFLIGMKGSKLVSDVISDAKLTTTQKKSVIILHDNNEIHWCIGLTIGRKSIARASSKNIIKVTIS
ncbi:MAG: tRNA lysidine(34) synthetase TilS [Crocinitomicaceae bacterium]